MSTKVNDTYLKAHSQTDGVLSYGRMVDLMLADFIRMSLRTDLFQQIASLATCLSTGLPQKP